MLIRDGTQSIDAMKSPAVIFLGIDDSRAKNAMTSPSLQITTGERLFSFLPFTDYVFVRALI
jgi:hypothetical protein